jgi:hypothetical protein
MNTETDDLSQAADEAVRDVKRGARRVGSALADGAAAVDEALVCSLADAPERTPGLARDLVKDHPIATLVTAAVVGAGAAKLIKVIRSR